MSIENAWSRWPMPFGGSMAGRSARTRFAGAQVRSFRRPTSCIRHRTSSSSGWARTGSTSSSRRLGRRHRFSRYHRWLIAGLSADANGCYVFGLAADVRIRGLAGPDQRADCNYPGAIWTMLDASSTALSPSASSLPGSAAHVAKEC